MSGRFKLRLGDCVAHIRIIEFFNSLWRVDVELLMLHWEFVDD